MQDDPAIRVDPLLPRRQQLINVGLFNPIAAHVAFDRHYIAHQAAT